MGDSTQSKLQTSSTTNTLQNYHKTFTKHIRNIFLYYATFILGCFSLSSFKQLLGSITLQSNAKAI